MSWLYSAPSCDHSSHGLSGAGIPPIPGPWQPEMQAIFSEHAMMITGFEETGAQRYYQGWYIKSESPVCGRVKQTNDPAQYFDYTRWNPLEHVWERFQASPNVPPGTRPLVLHRLGDGAQQVATLFWGYKPSWPGYTRGPASNARLDTVLKGSRFWKPLLTKRIIVPVDGWYEWTGDKGDKQPWFINPKDGHPVLMAGITAWQPGQEMLAETGFAIITDDVAGGMVDIHDRRPICLGVEDALAWLDPELPVDQALQLLSTARPESAFQWWEVTRQMSNSRYQMSEASQPLSGPSGEQS